MIGKSLRLLSLRFPLGIGWFWLWVLDLVLVSSVVSVDPEIQLLWQCNSARNLVLLALGFEVEFGSRIEFNFGLGFSKIQAELSGGNRLQFLGQLFGFRHILLSVAW
uniref:Uncharacterized protein n=1 Tax=Rhizophagus irregularis (strain DAOM 181602 / DAOM 197198 / MUCL 43194) TaxID=747089 RepID=U9T8I7_RHIID